MCDIKIEKMNILKDIMAFRLMGFRVLQWCTTEDNIEVLRGELLYLQKQQKKILMKRKINSYPWYLYKPRYIKKYISSHLKLA
jgi:hypothetical protein